MFPPERASYTANLMRRDGVLTNDELSTAVDIGINRDLFQATTESTDSALRSDG